MSYETIIVEKQDNGIAIVKLNRPKVLNALNRQLMGELRDALEELDDDKNVKVIVITGNERAFAAGADIKEMAPKGAIDMYLEDQFRTWDAIRRIRKPLIAAVSGYALGGGAELAMMCDIIVASDTAQFGQPEIKIGVIPGAGGTQWLPRIIGKSRAMEIILTGRMFSAKEAYEWGLVSKIVPAEIYLEEALKLAEQIANMPPVAVQLAKEAINYAYQSFIMEGIYFERKNFFLLFASEDQKEGMQAFLEKRKPQWKGK